MFSRKVLGRNKMSWGEYFWISILQGWSNVHYTFRVWCDLMSNNHQDYALLKEDDSLECCLGYFWDSIGEWTYEKEFLEYLYQMALDVEEGRVEVIPMTIEDLCEDVNSLIDSE